MAAAAAQVGRAVRQHDRISPSFKLVNLLVTSGAIAAFYGAFPTIFQQSAMTAAHKTQMLRYEVLLDGMAGHIATPYLVPIACLGQDAGTRPQVREQVYSVAEFIACTDVALAALDLPFALDPSRGPTTKRYWVGRPPIERVCNAPVGRTG
jgi:hypothetical protein